MQFQRAMHNYCSIIMRTITLHTIHVGALENYTQSNNITKLLTELSWAIEVMKITNVTIIFAAISQHTTCFMMNLTQKHKTDYNSIFDFVANFGSTNKKIGKIGSLSLKIGENRNTLKK